MTPDEQLTKAAMLAAIEYARITGTGISAVTRPGLTGRQLAREQVTHAAALESVRADAEADGIPLETALASLAIRIAHMIDGKTAGEVLGEIEAEVRALPG